MLQWGESEKIDFLEKIFSLIKNSFISEEIEQNDLFYIVEFSEM